MAAVSGPLTWPKQNREYEQHVHSQLYDIAHLPEIGAGKGAEGRGGRG